MLTAVAVLCNYYIYHYSHNYAAWLLTTRITHTNQSELTRSVIGLQGDNRKFWIKQNHVF
jgi:hypothetical protein